jgi:hypothetical protein
MELTELSDTDLMALATVENGCGDDGHVDADCLACQAYSVLEIRNPERWAVR